MGVYKNGVDTMLSIPIEEGGAEIHAGYRFAPIKALKAVGKPQPYVFVAVNTGGDTSLAGAGLSWKLRRGKIYVRPAIGVVVRDGPAYRSSQTLQMRTDLGSRVLFAPELAVGVQLSEKVSVEASWVHASHARLADSQQNPGLDQIGVRLSFKLGRR